ncbi:MAG: cupin domain-containing protein [Planctomycetota bacterium]|jgi:predicted cupin superfamily sugar epimerase
MTADEIIETLGLVPHPEEGGFFTETYRSAETVPASALPARYRGERRFGTAIYYLLKPGAVSALHRLKSDEAFHFYLGDPVTMLRLHPDGSSETLFLGSDLAAGEIPQSLVSRGTWQGSFLSEGGAFALMGCMVCPGFEYEDYEGGDAESLIRDYPDRADLIRHLCP